MVIPSQSSSEAGSSTGPHRMRITSGGSVPAYIRFALSFLNDNPHRPLVLHTMPPPAPSTDPGSKNTQTTKSRGTTLHTATTSAPRLISVVEQIKREYVEQSGTKGKRPSRGIWQYTESGLLPVEPTVDDEDPLVRVLEGKTRPKMTHHPYLQITLSTSPLGLEAGEAGRNVTCQYIMAKRKRGAATKNSVAEDVAKELIATEKGEGDEARPRGKTVPQRAPPKARDPGSLVKGQKRKSETDPESGGKRSKNGAGGTKHKTQAI